MDETELQGIHLHIHLPESLKDMVKFEGQQAVHIHIPDGLEKVVRDLGAEMLHERALIRMTVEAVGELLKADLMPQIVIPAPVVNVTSPEVKIRPAQVVVHLEPIIKAQLAPTRQRLVRDPLDGAVTEVITEAANGA